MLLVSLGLLQHIRADYPIYGYKDGALNNRTYFPRPSRRCPQIMIWQAWGDGRRRFLISKSSSDAKVTFFPTSKTGT